MGLTEIDNFLGSETPKAGGLAAIDAYLEPDTPPVPGALWSPDRQRWMFEGQPVAPAPPSTWRDRMFKTGQETLADPNATAIERFLAGFTAGGRQALSSAVQEPDIPKGIGEALAAPFSAVSQGVIESGAASPRTVEELGKLMMALTPVWTAPKPPRPLRAIEPLRAKEAMAEAPPIVRPIPEPAAGRIAPSAEGIATAPEIPVPRAMPGVPEPLTAVAPEPAMPDVIRRAIEPTRPELPSVGIGDVVEYRMRLSEKPITGTVTNVNADGTVNLRARDGGILRSLAPEKITPVREAEPVGLESQRIGKRVALSEVDAEILGEMKETVRDVQAEPTLGKRFTVDRSMESAEAAPSAMEVKGYSTGKPAWMEIPDRPGQYHEYSDVLKAIESLQRGKWPGTVRRQRIAEQLLQEVRFDAEQEKAKVAGYRAGAEEPTPSLQPALPEIRAVPRGQEDLQNILIAQRQRGGFEKTSQISKLPQVTSGKRSVQDVAGYLESNGVKIQDDAGLLEAPRAKGVAQGGSEQAAQDAFFGEVDRLAAEEAGVFQRESVGAPMRVETPEGARAVTAMDPRLMKVLGGNLYSGDLGVVAVKEMLQNATDSLRALEKPGTGTVRATVDSSKRIIEVTDTGAGMTPDVATRELVDIGGSSKAEGSAGGFGIAKVAIFSNAEDIRILTVAKDPRTGKVVATTLHGTGLDWADPSKGLSVESKPMPPDAQTGTTMTIRLSQETPFSVWPSKEYLQAFADSHRLEGKFTFKVDGGEVNPSGAASVERITSLPIQGATLDIYAAKATKRQPSIGYQVLNNGLPQFQDNFWTGNDLPLPERVIVDVKPTAGPDSAGYPFRPDRQGFRQHVTESLTNYFMNSLIMDAANADKALYVKAFKEGRPIGRTGVKLIDTTGALPAKVLDGLAAEPHLSVIAEQTKVAFHLLQAELAHLPQAEFGGIGLSERFLATNVMGRAIAGEGANNLILVNPYSVLAEVEQAIKLGQVKRAQAHEHFGDRLVAALIHEISHQGSRAHGEEFAGILTRSYATLARTAVKVADRIAEGLSPRDLFGRSTDVYDSTAKALGQLQPLWETAPDIFGKISTGLAEPRRGGRPAGRPVPGPAGGVEPPGPVRGRGEVQAEGVEPRPTVRPRAPRVREEVVRPGGLEPAPGPTPTTPSGASESASRIPEPIRRIVYGGRSSEFIPETVRERKGWETSYPVQDPQTGQWGFRKAGEPTVSEGPGGPAPPKPAGPAVPPPPGEPPVTLGSIGGAFQEAAGYLPESLRALPAQYRRVVQKGIDALVAKMPKVFREARGLGEEYVDVVHDRGATLANYVERAVELSGKLQHGLTESEKARVDQVLRGGITVNPAIQRIVEPVRGLINELQGKLIEHGYLTPEDVQLFQERFRSHPDYLRRLYETKLVPPDQPFLAGELTGPVGRGVKSEALMMRGDIQEVKLPSMGGEPLVGAQRADFLGPWLKKGYRLIKAEGDTATLFRDIPEPIRKAMGEVRDKPGFVAAKTAVEQARIVANHEFLAKIPEILPDSAKVGLTEAEFASGEWTRLTGDKKKWGPLADYFVKKDVALEVQNSIRIRQDWEKVIGRLVGLWKYGKVIVNPAAMGRNIISSGILADFGGLHPYMLDEWAKGANQIRKGDGVWPEAKQLGLFRSGFAQNEILALSEGVAKSTQPNGMLRMLDAVHEIAEAGRQKTGFSPSRIYAAIENFYRFNLYRYARETLNQSPKDARRYALKYAIDYEVVSPFVAGLRGTGGGWAAPLAALGGAPFITFSAKAIPLTLETLALHPLRVLKYPAIIYGISKMAGPQIGQSPEETTAQRALGSLNAMRYMLLPFRDKDGRAMYYDLGYTLPFGDLIEAVDAFSGGTGRRANISFLPLVGHPVAGIFEAVLNRSGFTGKDISEPSDTALQSLQKRVGHIYQTWMPSLAPPVPGLPKGGYGYEDLRRGFATPPETDFMGRTRSPVAASLASLAGLRAQGVTTAELANFKAKQYEDMLDSLDREALTIATKYRMNPEEANRRMEQLKQRAIEIATEAKGLFSMVPRGASRPAVPAPIQKAVQAGR